MTLEELRRLKKELSQCYIDIKTLQRQIKLGERAVILGWSKNGAPIAEIAQAISKTENNVRKELEKAAVKKRKAIGL